MAAQAGVDEPILQKELQQESEGGREDVQNSSTHIDKEAIDSKKHENPISVAFENPKTGAHTATDESITIKEDENLHFVTTGLVDKSEGQDFVEVPPPSTAQIQFSNDSNTDLDGDKSIKEIKELLSRGNLEQKENGDETEEEEDRSIIRDIYNENKVEVVFHNQTAENVHALYEIINEVEITENSRDVLVYKIGILRGQTENMKKETSAALDNKRHDFEVIPTSFAGKEPLYPSAVEKEICPESNRTCEMTENEELALKEQSQISKNNGILKKLVVPIFSSDQGNTKSEGIFSLQSEKNFMITDNIENPRPRKVENEKEETENSDGENLEEVCKGFLSENARYDISRAVCVDEVDSATATEDRNVLDQETTRIGNKNENRNQKEAESNVHNSNAPNLQLQNLIGLTIEERNAEELRKTSEVMQNKDKFQLKEVTQDEVKLCLVNSGMQLSVSQNEEIENQDDAAEIDTQRDHTENPHIKIALELSNQTNICEQKENDGSKQKIVFKNGNGVTEARTTDEIDEKINTDEEQEIGEEHNESNRMQLGNQTSGENMQLQSCYETSTKDDQDDIIEASECKENLEITTTEYSNIVIISEVDASTVKQSPEETQILQKESEEVVPAKKPASNTENPCSILDYKDEKMYASLMDVSIEAAEKESREKTQILQESKENITAKNPESSIELASSIPDYTEEEVNTSSIDASIEEVTADEQESSAKNARTMPDYKDEKVTTLSTCASIEEASEKELPAKMQILKEEVQEVVTADKSASIEHSRNKIDYKVEKVNTLSIDASIEEETEKESLEKTQIHQEESGEIITDGKPQSSTENTNTLLDIYEDGRVNTSLINASIEEAAEKESVEKTQVHQEENEEFVTAKKPPSSSENPSILDNKDKVMNTSLIDDSTEYAAESESLETTLLQQEESEELAIVEKTEKSTEKVSGTLSYEDEKVDTSSIGALIKEATEKELPEETQTFQAKSEEMVMAEQLASNTKNQRSAADYYDEKMKTSSTRVSIEEVGGEVSIEKTQLLKKESKKIVIAEKPESSTAHLNSVPDYNDEKVNISSIYPSVEESAEKRSEHKTQMLQEKSEDAATAKKPETNIENSSTIPSYEDEKVNTSINASMERASEQESLEEAHTIQQDNKETITAEKPESSIEIASSIPDYEDEKVNTSSIEESLEKTLILHERSEDVVTTEEPTINIENPSSISDYEDEKLNTSSIDASIEEAAEKETQTLQEKSKENAVAKNPKSGLEFTSSIADYKDEKVNTSSLIASTKEAAEKGSIEKVLVFHEKSEEVRTANEPTSNIEIPSSITDYVGGKVNTASIDDSVEEKVNTSSVDDSIEEASEKDSQEKIQILQEERKESVTAEKPESSIEFAGSIPDYDENMNTSSINASIEEATEKDSQEKTQILHDERKQNLPAEKSESNIEFASSIPNYEDEKVNTSSVDASVEDAVRKGLLNKTQVLHEKIEEVVTTEEPTSVFEKLNSTPDYEDEKTNTSSLDASTKDVAEKYSQERKLLQKGSEENVTAEKLESSTKKASSTLDFEDEEVNTSSIDVFSQEEAEKGSLEETLILEETSENVLTDEKLISKIENSNNISVYEDEKVNTSSIGVFIEKAAEKESQENIQTLWEESKENVTAEKPESSIEFASGIPDYEDEKVNTSSIDASIEAKEKGSLEQTLIFDENSEEVVTAEKPTSNIEIPNNIPDYEDEKVNTSSVDTSGEEAVEKDSQERTQIPQEKSKENVTDEKTESNIEFASSTPDYEDENVNISPIETSIEGADDKGSLEKAQVLHEKSEVVTAEEATSDIENSINPLDYVDEKVNTSLIEPSVEEADEAGSLQKTQILQEQSEKIATVEEPTLDIENPSSIPYYKDEGVNTSSTDASIEDAAEDASKDTQLPQKESEEIVTFETLESGTEKASSISDYEDEKVTTSSIYATIEEAAEKGSQEKTQILEEKNVVTADKPIPSIERPIIIQNYEDERMNTSIDASMEEVPKKESLGKKQTLDKECREFVTAEELESSIEIASSIPDYDDEKVSTSPMDASIEEAAEKETRILQVESEEVVTANEPTSNVENPSSMRDFSDEKVNTASIDASIGTAERESSEKTQTLQEESKEIVTVEKSESSIQIALHYDDEKMNTSSTDASIEEDVEKESPEKTEIIHEESEDVITAQNLASSTESQSNIANYDEKRVNTLSIDASIVEAAEKALLEKTQILYVECEESATAENPKSSTNNTSSIPVFKDEKTNTLSIDSFNEEATEEEAQERTHRPQEDNDAVIAEKLESSIEIASSIPHYDDEKVNTSSLDASIEEAAESPKETQILQEKSEEVVTADEPAPNVENPNSIQYLNDEKVNTASIDASIRIAERESPEKTQTLQEESKGILTIEKPESSIQVALHYDDEKMNTSSTDASIEEDAEKESPEKTEIFQEESEDVITAQNLASSTKSQSNIANYDEKRVNTLSIDTFIVEAAEKELLEKSQILHVECEESATAENPKSSTNNTSSIPVFEDEKMNTLSVDSFNKEATEEESQEKTHTPQEDSDVVIAEELESSIKIASSIPGYDDEKVNILSMDATIEELAEKETRILQEESEEVVTANEPTSNVENPSSNDEKANTASIDTSIKTAERESPEKTQTLQEENSESRIQVALHYDDEKMNTSSTDASIEEDAEKESPEKTEIFQEESEDVITAQNLASSTESQSNIANYDEKNVNTSTIDASIVEAAEKALLEKAQILYVQCEESATAKNPKSSTNNTQSIPVFEDEKMNTLSVDSFNEEATEEESQEKTHTPQEDSDVVIAEELESSIEIASSIPDYDDEKVNISSLDVSTEEEAEKETPKETRILQEESEEVVTANEPTSNVENSSSNDEKVNTASIDASIGTAERESSEKTQTLQEESKEILTVEKSESSIQIALDYDNEKMNTSSTDASIEEDAEKESPEKTEIFHEESEDVLTAQNLASSTESQSNIANYDEKRVNTLSIDASIVEAAEKALLEKAQILYVECEETATAENPKSSTNNTSSIPVFKDEKMNTLSVDSFNEEATEEESQEKTHTPQEDSDVVIAEELESSIEIATSIPDYDDGKVNISSMDVASEEEAEKETRILQEESEEVVTANEPTSNVENPSSNDEKVNTASTDTSIETAERESPEKTQTLQEESKEIVTVENSESSIQVALHYDDEKMNTSSTDASIEDAEKESPEKTEIFQELSEDVITSQNLASSTESQSNIANYDEKNVNTSTIDASIVEAAEKVLLEKTQILHVEREESVTAENPKSSTNNTSSIPVFKDAKMNTLSVNSFHEEATEEESQEKTHTPQEDSDVVIDEEPGSSTQKPSSIHDCEDEKKLQQESEVAKHIQTIAFESFKTSEPSHAFGAASETGESIIIDEKSTVVQSVVIEMLEKFEGQVFVEIPSLPKAQTPFNNDSDTYLHVDNSVKEREEIIISRIVVQNEEEAKVEEVKEENTKIGLCNEQVVKPVYQIAKNDALNEETKEAEIIECSEANQVHKFETAADQVENETRESSLYRGRKEQGLEVIGSLYRGCKEQGLEVIDNTTEGKDSACTGAVEKEKSPGNVDLCEITENKEFAQKEESQVRQSDIVLIKELEVKNLQIEQVKTNCEETSSLQIEDNFEIKDDSQNNNSDKAQNEIKDATSKSVSLDKRSSATTNERKTSQDQEITYIMNKEKVVQKEEGDANNLNASISQLPSRIDSSIEEGQIKELGETSETVQNKDQCQEKNTCLYEVELSILKSGTQPLLVQNEEVDDQDEANKNHHVEEALEILDRNYIHGEKEKVGSIKTIACRQESNEGEARMTGDEEARINKDEDHKGYDGAKQSKQASEETSQIKSYCVAANDTPENVPQVDECKENLEISGTQVDKELIMSKVDASIEEADDKETQDKTQVPEEERVITAEIPTPSISTETRSSLLDYEDQKVYETADANENANEDLQKDVEDFFISNCPIMDKAKDPVVNESEGNLVKELIHPATTTNDSKDTRMYKESVEAEKLSFVSYFTMEEQNYTPVKTSLVCARKDKKTQKKGMDGIQINEGNIGDVVCKKQEDFNAAAEEQAIHTKDTADNRVDDGKIGEMVQMESDKLKFAQDILHENPTQESASEINSVNSDQETANLTSNNILEDQIDENSNRPDLVTHSLIQNNEQALNLDKNVDTLQVPRKKIEEARDLIHEIHEDDDDEVCKNMELVEQDCTPNNAAGISNTYSTELNHEGIADTETQGYLKTQKIAGINEVVSSSFSTQKDNLWEAASPEPYVKNIYDKRSFKVDLEDTHERTEVNKGVEGTVGTDQQAKKIEVEIISSEKHMVDEELNKKNELKRGEESIKEDMASEIILPNTVEQSDDKVVENDKNEKEHENVKDEDLEITISAETDVSITELGEGKDLYEEQKRIVQENNEMRIPQEAAVEGTTDADTKNEDAKTSDINHVNIGEETPRETDDDDESNSASDVPETNDLAAQFMHAATNNHDIIMDCKCREEFQEISKIKFCITEDDNTEEARQMLESSADLAQDHKNEERNSEIMARNLKYDGDFSSEIIDENTIIENEESHRMKQSLVTQSTEALADKEVSLIQNDQETTKHDEGTCSLQYEENSLQKEDSTQGSDFDKGKNEKDIEDSHEKLGSVCKVAESVNTSGVIPTTSQETDHCEGMVFTGNENISEVKIEKSDVSYSDASCAQSSKQVELILEERNPEEFQETYEFVQNNNQCNEVILEEMKPPVVQSDMQILQAPNKKVNDQEEAVDKHTEIIPDKISDVQESSEMVVIQKLIHEAEKISRDNNYNNYFSEDETCAAEAMLSFEVQIESKKENGSNELKIEKQTSEGSIQIKTHHDIPVEQTLESPQETPEREENIEMYVIEILNKSIKHETGASVDKHTATTENGHPEHSQEQRKAILTSDQAEARICTEDTSSIQDNEDGKIFKNQDENHVHETAKVKDESTVGKEIYNGSKMYEKVMDCILPKHEGDPNSDKNIGDKINEMPEDASDKVNVIMDIIVSSLSSTGAPVEENIGKELSTEESDGDKQDKIDDDINEISDESVKVDQKGIYETIEAKRSNEETISGDEKTNNIAVDVISLGEQKEGEELNKQKAATMKDKDNDISLENRTEIPPNDVSKKDMITEAQEQTKVGILGSTILTKVNASTIEFTKGKDLPKEQEKTFEEAETCIAGEDEIVGSVIAESSKKIHNDYAKDCNIVKNIEFEAMQVEHEECINTIDKSSTVIPAKEEEFQKHETAQRHQKQVLGFTEDDKNYVSALQDQSKAEAVYSAETKIWTQIIELESSCDENIADVQEDSSSIKGASDVNNIQINATELKSVAHYEISREDNGEQELETILQAKEREDENHEEDNDVKAQVKPCEAATVNVYNKEIAKENITTKRIPENQKLDYVDAEISLVAPYDLDIADKCTYTDKEYQGDQAEQNLENKEMAPKEVVEVRPIILCGNEIQASDATEYLSLQEQVLKLANSDMKIDYNHSKDNPIETMQLKELPNQLQIAEPNEIIGKSMAKEDIVQAPISDEANVANKHFLEKDNEVKKIELGPTLEENNSITTSKEAQRNMVSETEIPSSKDMTMNIFDNVTSATDEHEVSENSTRGSAMDIKTKAVNIEAANKVCRSGRKFNINEASEEHPDEISISQVQSVDSGTIDQEDRVNPEEISKSVSDICTGKEKNPSVEFMEEEKLLGNLTNNQATKACMLHEEEKLEQAERPSYELAGLRNSKGDEQQTGPDNLPASHLTDHILQSEHGIHVQSVDSGTIDQEDRVNPEEISKSVSDICTGKEKNPSVEFMEEEEFLGNLTNNQATKACMLHEEEKLEQAERPSYEVADLRNSKGDEQQTGPDNLPASHLTDHLLLSEHGIHVVKPEIKVEEISEENHDASISKQESILATMKTEQATKHTRGFEDKVSKLEDSSDPTLEHGHEAVSGNNLHYLFVKDNESRECDADKSSSAAGMDRITKEVSSLLAEGTKESTKFISGNKMEFSSSDVGEFLKQSHVQDDEKTQASIVGRTIAISVHDEDENQKNGIIQKGGKDDTMILQETEKKDQVSNTQLEETQSFVSKQIGDTKVSENGKERLLNLQSDEIVKLKSSNFDDSRVEEAPQIKSRGIGFEASKENQDIVPEPEIQNLKGDDTMSVSHKAQKFETIGKFSNKVVQKQGKIIEETCTNANMDQRQTSEEMDAHQDEDRTDDENDEHESKDEHAKTEHSHDSTLVAESKDANSKPPNKKSHNILSGVRSKVKRSIAKVKKVITGKTSHTKTASPP